MYNVLLLKLIEQKTKIMLWQQISKPNKFKLIKWEAAPAATAQEKYFIKMSDMHKSIQLVAIMLDIMLIFICLTAF